MPIVTQCPQCGKRLKAPDDRLGKQAKCPDCKAGFTITPVAEGAAQEQPVAAPKGVAATSAAPVQARAGSSTPVPVTAIEPAVWHVRTADGAEYGPVTKTDLDSWVTDERLDAECQVLMDGWEQWKWAEEVYPALASRRAQNPQPEVPELVLANEPFVGPAGQSPANPYSVGSPPERRRPSYETPGRAANPLVDFLVFRRMVVPVLVQILFWLGVVAVIFAGVRTLIAGIQFDNTEAIVTGIVFITIGPLYVRTVCELVVVVFRINETLTDIRTELRRGRHDKD